MYKKKLKTSKDTNSFSLSPPKIFRISLQSKRRVRNLVTLREEHRLRMFENRVLMRIFGPRRDEVTGEWRKLHNEELQNLAKYN
jgi:hypothetical protein